MINNQISSVNPGGYAGENPDENPIIMGQFEETAQKESSLKLEKNKGKLFLKLKNNILNDDAVELFKEIEKTYSMTYEERDKMQGRLKDLKDTGAISLSDYYKYRNLSYKKAILNYDDYDNQFNKKLDILMDIDEKKSITNEEYDKYLKNLEIFQKITPEKYKLTEEEYKDYKNILKVKSMCANMFETKKSQSF